MLREFRLRPGSGGAGRWRGGDGVAREIEFLRPMAAGILSERRATAPFGLAGGAPGAKGLNLLVRRADGRAVSLGGKATVAVAAGDALRVLTPGGGGYGNGDGARDEEDGGGGAGERRTSAAGGSSGVEPRGSVHAWKMLQESA